MAPTTMSNPDGKKRVKLTELMQEAFNEYLSEVYSLKAKIELMDMKRWWNKVSP